MSLSVANKAEFINSSGLLTPTLHYPSHSIAHPPDYKYVLYPIKKIDAFHNELRTSNTDDFRIAQYIVTDKQQLLISREGTPGMTIPRHQHMNKGSILSAGYIFFEGKSGKIVGISNESSDFEHLNLKCLLWPVAILQLMNAPVADIFSITPNHEIRQFELNKKDRQTIVEGIPSRLRKSALAANQCDKIIKRASSERRESFFTFLPKLDREDAQDKIHHSLIECAG